MELDPFSCSRDDDRLSTPSYVNGGVRGQHESDWHFLVSVLKTKFVGGKESRERRAGIELLPDSSRFIPFWARSRACS